MVLLIEFSIFSDAVDFVIHSKHSTRGSDSSNYELGKIAKSPINVTYIHLYTLIVRELHKKLLQYIINRSKLNSSRECKNS